MRKTLTIISIAIISTFQVIAQGGAAINTTGATADPSAMLDVSSSNAGILIPRMTEAQKNTITSPATGLMIYQTDGTSGLWYYDGAAWMQPGASGSACPAHTVGEFFGGGLIIYTWDNGNHGLIVSPVDISTASSWSNITSTLIGTTNAWDGSSNTTAIINQPGHTVSAAKLCRNYNNGGFIDWYLPAENEISLMWNSRFIINKFLGSNGLNVWSAYWTSTEYNASNVLTWNPAWGYSDYKGKASTNMVRCFRNF